MSKLKSYLTYSKLNLSMSWCVVLSFCKINELKQWNQNAAKLGNCLSENYRNLSEFWRQTAAQLFYDRFRCVFEANSSFAAVSEVYWVLIAPNLMILLRFRSNLKYKIIFERLVSLKNTVTTERWGWLMINEWESCSDTSGTARQRDDGGSHL